MYGILPRIDIIPHSYHIKISNNLPWHCASNKLTKTYRIVHFNSTEVIFFSLLVQILCDQLTGTKKGVDVFNKAQNGYMIRLICTLHQRVYTPYCLTQTTGWHLKLYMCIEIWYPNILCTVEQKGVSRNYIAH